MTSATDFADWQSRWQARQPTRPAGLLTAMQRANPCYIPRNHRVEEALAAAKQYGFSLDEFVAGQSDQVIFRDSVAV